MTRREMLAASLSGAFLVACDPGGSPGTGSVWTGGETGGSSLFVDTDALGEALSLFDGSPFEDHARGLPEALDAALSEVADHDPATAEVLAAFIATVALPRFEAARLAQGAFDEDDLIAISAEGLDVDGARLTAALESWVPVLEEGDPSTPQQSYLDLAREVRGEADSQDTLDNGYVQRICADLDGFVAALDRPTSELVEEARAGVDALVRREDFDPGPTGPPTEECDDSEYQAAQIRAHAAITLSYIGMMRLVMGLSAAGPIGMILGLMTLAIGIPLMVGSMMSIYERAYIRMCNC
ncbi:MAG TPA: hypothetical protein QGF58_07800 [Myxococcota bacterium]|nr:hypothetical protein [Myxococcota bacterium]